MLAFIGRLIDDRLLKEQVKLIVQNSIAIDKLSSYIPEDDLEFLRSQTETAMETIISGDEISQNLRDRFAALNIKLRTTHTNSLMKSMGTFSSLYEPEAGWDIFLRATLPKIKAARLAKKDHAGRGL